jgi:hypothetical protein
MSDFVNSHDPQRYNNIYIVVFVALVVNMNRMDVAIRLLFSKDSLILLLLISCIVVDTATALDNGVGLTPPMGFNTWNNFACDINEDVFKETAKAMVDTGLKDLGYGEGINIDC